MQINIYVTNSGTFTVNVFDNDGYVAGGLSTSAGTGVATRHVVDFIDNLRNKEPENVKARICMGGLAPDVELNMIVSSRTMYEALEHAGQTIRDITVGA